MRLKCSNATHHYWGDVFVISAGRFELSLGRADDADVRDVAASFQARREMELSTGSLRARLFKRKAVAEEAKAFYRATIIDFDIL